MTTKPEDKAQLNTYVPHDINEWVNSTRDATGLTKSEIVHLLIAYVRKFWTKEDIMELADSMRLLGESGLERLPGR